MRWTEVSEMLHIFQVRYTRTYIHTHTNQQNMFLLSLMMLFFHFVAEFHSSDSSGEDDDVPCLGAGSVQQEYGRNAAPFYKPQYKFISTRIFLHNQQHNRHVCVCVFQSQNTGLFYLTLRARVTSCWTLSIHWTTGSGGGNHGDGGSSKSSRYVCDGRPVRWTVKMPF